MRVRQALSLLTLTALAVGLAVVPSSPASAGEAIREFATVTGHGDGDTVYIRVDGASADTKVRLTGIQAPEVVSDVGVVSKDQCGAVASRDKLDDLLPVGMRVALRSLSASATNGGRLLRAIYRQGADGYNDTNEGSWGYDVGRAMMKSGLALWFPHPTEIAHNREYQVLALQAQAAKTGLWNPSYCGQGPAASVSMYVNWDAPGDDNKNINGEYFVIRNHSSSTLSIAGWLLRDSALEWFTFPKGATIAPKNWVRVRVGKGTNSGRTYYYGSSKTMFANAVPGGTYLGDAAYLFDKIGNLRTSFTYGCPEKCTDYAKGKIVVSSVRYAGTANQEWVLLKNVSTKGVYLERYYLRHRWLNYTMGISTYIPAGGSFAVHMGKGTRSAKHQYVGLSSPALSSVGKVELISLRNVVISCKAWGGTRC